MREGATREAMTIAPPSLDRVERFRADLEAQTGSTPGRLGVAVSGGPDSLALLLLAAAAFPGQVEAATVDHGLRPESAAEAAFVANACSGLGVGHAILPLSWPETPAGNVQAIAREARYAELGVWAAARDIHWVATGHHLDDQAETLLLRLARGSGIGGLSGIRPIGLFGREGYAVWAVRPLLGWRKRELAEVVSDAGLEPVEDPSNQDQRFDRTRARELLASTPWLAPERLAAAAANLAEAEAALSWMTHALFRERAGGDPPGYTVDATGLPDELQRRLVRQLLQNLTGEDPAGPKLTRLLSTLQAGGTATLCGVKCRGGDLWRFGPAPPHR